MRKLATAVALALGSVALPTQPAAADDPVCAPDQTPVSLVSFNDFHGRLTAAPAMFTVIEQIRAEVGEANVGLVSVGDDIGGSTFESMADDDNPALKVLAAAGLNAQAVGNHEFDKGWSDLSGRVNSALPVDQLGANVYRAGTTDVASPLKASTTFSVGGLKVAVVGAVTKDLPSLVSPAGISDLTIGDPVKAVNDEVAKLPADVDLVVAAIHEGAPSGSGTGDDQAAASANFADMWRGLDPKVRLVLNGHTHQSYSWTNSAGQQFTQAASYATQVNEFKFCATADGQLSGTATTKLRTVDPKVVDVTLPRVAQIQKIVDDAVANADVIGAKVIGSASQPISTPTGNADVRDVESAMSNLVAQMFHEVLAPDDPSFIGIQNPGGTRDSFDQGDITYKEAALTLPFANTLMTTQLTGAQFKTVLEQQWQRKADGTVPSRPFLRLGLSKNVSYTYDESKPEGSRITGVFVGGKPIDPAATYTVGSGSFLIAGGDNFHELAKGTGTKDSGRVDLEAWTGWVTAKKSLAPDYSKRGVSLSAAPAEIAKGGSGTFTFDIAPGGLARESLDLMVGAATGKDPRDPSKVTPAKPNTTATVFLDGKAVGTATVTDGKATITASVPGTCEVKPGARLLTFEFGPSGTMTYAPVTITGDATACPAPSPTPPPTKPGLPDTGA